MRTLLTRIEDSFATLIAVAIVVLPLAEIAVRGLLDTGLPGSGPFTLHLTLWVGLIGAAIAARDGKLLTLATGTLWPEGRVREIARILGHAGGVLVATVFAVSGFELIALHREVGTLIALDVPVWIAALIFPVAFGLIAVRLTWTASSTMAGRAACGLALVAGAWIARNPDAFAGQPAWPWLVAIVAAAILGTPIFAVLGGVRVY